MSKNYIGQVTMKAILKYKDGYVLVRQENEEKWILPGGRLDFGETPDEGVLRELKEELSLDCIIDKIISLDAYQGKEGKLPKLFVFYQTSVIDGKDLVIDNEISEYAIVRKIEDLANYPMYSNQKKVLETYLS